MVILGKNVSCFETLLNCLLSFPRIKAVYFMTRVYICVIVGML